MEKKDWPAWAFGPNDQSAIFENPAEVPKGWVSHPSLLTGKAAPTPPPVLTPAASVPEATVTEPATEAKTPHVDAEGHPWSADLHSASKTMTKAGLWRMKVGATRPAPITLDL